MDLARKLTPCELQVCQQLAETTLVQKEIAARLGKSLKTVSVQVSSAYKKLGVKNRFELIRVLEGPDDPPLHSINAILRRLDAIEKTLQILVLGKEA